MTLLDPRLWPIRWRITALIVGVLAATLILVGGVFLLQLESALLGLSADHLRDQARVALEGPPPSSVDVNRTPPPFNFQRASAGLVRRLSGPDTGVLVFDTLGELVNATEVEEGVEDWPRPSASQITLTLGGQESTLVVSQQTRRALVLLLPLRGPDGSGTLGALVLAHSLQFTDQLQAGLTQALAAGTVVAMLLAGALGFRATRAALQPLDRVVLAARRIAAGDLEERLRLHRKDEVGELAEAFDRMLDRLAFVVTAQRRFVADAAHEIRTPLTALGGMVEMLQLGADRGDRATVERMLGTMEREIGRLGRLVADLLTLSVLDSEQPLARSPVELAPLITEVAGQARLLADGHDIRLHIDAAPVVSGSTDRLKQVLLNLASNAITHTPTDGRIEFRLEQLNGCARLVVSDSGRGIPAEALPRIMDRFVRGDPSRTRATGGSGLGLAIAQGIVEAHGGTITLESEAGRGTSAIIELPISQRPSGNLQDS